MAGEEETVDPQNDDRFIPIWEDFWNSSIMEAPVGVRFLFMTMMKMCDKEGRFRSTIPNLARVANMPTQDVEAAIRVLTSPDPNSTTPDHDGQRVIQTGPNLWWIPNVPLYRKKFKLYRDRKLAAARQERFREKNKDSVTDRDDALPTVTDRDTPLRDVTDHNPYTSSSASASTSSSSSSSTTVPTPKKSTTVTEKEEDQGFEDWWVAYPQGRRVKKAKARVTWGRMTREERVKALAALGQHTEMWEREGRPIDKIPHPTTWLNARQWEDEIPDPGQYREKRKGGSVDMNVGKRVDPEESEKRRRKVRAAILTHLVHLQELDCEPEVAPAVGQAISALKDLVNLCNSDKKPPEGILAEQFGQIHDLMLDHMVHHVMTSEEVEKMREWVGARHAHHEAAKNALGAHLRKAVRERVGVNDICEYDWEG
jgi:hypothetical protein